jgi:UDP-N-acetylmuramoyl-tripeptide--D-alanyl-D-alanine ligase
MNHAGEIRYLTGLAKPDIALVNNAGTAHIGILGSREAIAHAKGEIYEGLSDRGVAVVNADDAFADLWRGMNAGRTIIDFGLQSPARVTGRYTGHALSSDIVLNTPAGEARFSLGMPGVHNVRNALAAAAASFALHVPIAVVGRALAGFQGPKARMQRSSGINASVLIDDSYNANPDSTLAAINALADMPGKRVLVLGDMGELGDQGVAEHVRVGEAARAAGIDRLFTLGELSERSARAFGASGRHFSRIEDLLAAVELELAPGTTLLVKGSRFMRMERVVESFKVERA